MAELFMGSLFVLSVLGLIHTQDNSLYDRYIIVLNLGVIYERQLYICKVPCDAWIYSLMRGVVLKKKETYKIMDFKIKCK